MKPSCYLFLLALFYGIELYAGPIVITGASIHTLTEQGQLHDATVIFDEGKITGIGKDIAIPEGATRIDAKGKVITPGLFDSHTYLGLVEVSRSKQTRDAEIKDYELGAGFSIRHGINPVSSLIPITRMAGVTSAVVAPYQSDDIFSGQGSIIRLVNNDRFIVVPYVAQYISLGIRGSNKSGGSRSAALIRLRQALEDTSHYQQHKQDYDQGKTRDYTLGRLDLEALEPVVNGDIPMTVWVNRAADIEQLLSMRKNFPIKLIINGGREAWKVADKIAAAKIPVILNPLDNIPRDFDSLDARLTNAAKLQQAGVLIAFSTYSAHNVRKLRQLAGNAVAWGMAWEAALAAITINPAKIWGLDKDYGSIAPGKVEDLVIWNGDPFEVTTYAEQVFVAGDAIPMVSRQTLLRDRYKQLKNRTRPFAYD